MSVLWVPYHLDDHLPELGLPLMPEKVIVAEPPGGDVWARLAHLYAKVVEAVAAAAARGRCPTVFSGERWSR